MSFVSVESYDTKLSRAADRALETLARREDRNHDQYFTKRAHQRQDFHGIVEICFPEYEDSDGKTPSIRVKTSDVSASGIGFVYPGELAVNEVHVGLTVPGKDPVWFQGDLVRAQQIPDERFWEFGVRFRGRL